MYLIHLIQLEEENIYSITFFQLQTNYSFIFVTLFSNGEFFFFFFLLKVFSTSELPFLRSDVVKDANRFI